MQIYGTPCTRVQMPEHVATRARSIVAAERSGGGRERMLVRYTHFAEGESGEFLFPRGRADRRARNIANSYTRIHRELIVPKFRY